MAVAATSSRAQPGGVRFRDPEPLARFIAVLLVVQVALAAVNILSLLFRLKLLSDLQNRAYAGGLEASSVRIGILGLIWVVLLVVIAVFILKWIYRSAKNVIALGFHTMKTSPRWAIGWFFVPVADLYMPYKTMKEIWRGSQSPGTKATGTSIIGWWWGLLLLFFVLDQLALWLGRNPQTGTEILLATGLAIVQAALIIPLNLVFLRLMHDIVEMQKESFAWASKRK